MATIKDVSKLANVSISTVSRVVNDTAKVDPEKKQAVLDAMKELKYRPNSFAQALVSKRSDCIGLMVGDLGGGPFFVQMISGIESVLDQNNKFLMVVTGQHELKKEQAAIDFLLQRQCDALILHSMALSDESLIELSEGDVPIIIVNRLVPGLEQRCIFLNNLFGAQQATSHLTEQGHKKIAYIATNDLSFADGTERFAGYKAALDQAGLKYDPSLVVRNFPDENGGVQAVEQLLSQQIEFSAIFCHNDSMAAGASSLLRERGYEIPKDISVVGFDDTKYAQFVYPKLTTVRYPIKDMGAKAAEYALALLSDDQQRIAGIVNDNLEFQPELIVRDTVNRK